MRQLNTEFTELGKDKLFFYRLVSEFYYNPQKDTEYILQTISDNLNPYQDIGILLLKFNKLMYGIITKKEMDELDKNIRPSYYVFRKDLPHTYISMYEFEDPTPLTIEQNAILSKDKFQKVIYFTALLRKLFIDLNINNIYSILDKIHRKDDSYIKDLKEKLSQINNNVFLELYRALINLELQAPFSDIKRIAVLGGKGKASSVYNQKLKRINDLLTHITSMSHDEILDLLSTKQNCFNKLFELDYAYQQKENTITKSKLSLQQIKESVENEDGTYNLASTSVGRWLVKEMKIRLRLALKDKPNYKLYCEIPWFKNYIKQFLK